MAKIAVATKNLASTNAVSVRDMLVSLGHVAILENSTSVLSSQLQTYDLIVAVDYAYNYNAFAGEIIDALNAGTPVIDGYTGSSYSTRSIFYELGYGITGNEASSSNGFTPRDNQDFLSPYETGVRFVLPSAGNLRYKMEVAYYDSSTIVASEDDDINSVEWFVSEVNGTKYAGIGFLSNVTNYPQQVKDEFNKLIKNFSGESDLIISGKVTLDKSPVSQTVIAITNDINDMKVIGTAQSDPTTGDYSIVTTYNKPVMVFTMQDYGVEWKDSLDLAGGDTVHPTTSNGCFYKVIQAGITGNSEPNWPTEAGAAVTDGGVVYTTEILLKPEIAGYKKPTPIS